MIESRTLGIFRLRPGFSGSPGFIHSDLYELPGPGGRPVAEADLVFGW